ncbi:saccharopine dehydrogenase [Paenibacillus selenitireducens]|uniref:Saccharopine dehydrogenase n=1 Tax=Paenibacillus selenitireducens TaxID=1324314 RepID=A0A1T2X5V0_9BACL|nr:saccharopine dehydrogenase NADP-binding domain-containing protein [Paenibacillus selenitireducens]OPA75258.1 saccharopine dehydrogenase [Paenibacillus selenitireducens]
MRDRIMVIGGYGHVGQTLCKELGKRYPGKVYAAGRNLDKAEQFCRTTGGDILPFQIDISNAMDKEILHHVKLVVMCMDQKNTFFVRSCLAQGIHYIDVSADYSFLSQVEDLHSIASEHHATAVLSVGLAPGITNLLALEASKAMDKVHRLDISIMLGTGDSHGQAAIEWTVDNIGKPMEVMEKGQRVRVPSFTNGRSIDFGEPMGQMRAYRFNFSDQHVLPRTLGIPTVTTRLCFDSGLVTRSLALFQRLGLTKLLNNNGMRKLAVQLFGQLKLGTDQYALKVDAWGRKSHKKVRSELFLHGNNEARITALTAAAVANIVYEKSLRQGVFHIEQLLDWQTVRDSVELSVQYKSIMMEE